jgi:DNA-binding NarL/FixJ family response regulator
MEARFECGARQPTAMQFSILVCHKPLRHIGAHNAYTDGGMLASWFDDGRVHFSPKPRTHHEDSEPESAQRTLSGSRPRLTGRQAAVLAGLLAGRTASSIAETVGVAESSVRMCIRTVRVKFGVTSDTALIAAARQLGLEPA